MKNENLVFLVGNLTRDPELRNVTMNDKTVSVVNFRIAVSDEYKTSAGNSNKITTYINCEAWDSAATRIAEALSKGDGIFVKGTLRSDSWEKDGVKHNSLKVRVGSFTPLGKSRNVNSEEPVAAAAGNKTPF